MILAIETVRRTVSVAVVAADGHELWFRQGGEAERDAAALLAEALATCGRPTVIACANGPGSFTGLRVGVMAVRTLAWLDHLPVIAVDALVARACAAGPGRWWVLQSLKKDTTHHALIQITAAGAIVVERPTVADLDALPVADASAYVGAIAIGPGLADKPGLTQRWCPGMVSGDVAPLTSRGVAQAVLRGKRLDSFATTMATSAQTWADLFPAYHQDAAPVLQRRSAPPIPSA